MRSDVIDRQRSRRQVLIGSVAGAAALVVTGGRFGTAQEATPAPGGTPAAGDRPYLAVADPVAEALYVYLLPGGEFVARIDGVAVNAHAGFLPLLDGRLLFLDDLGRRLMAVRIDAGRLVTDEAPVPGTASSHVAVDSDRAQYAAVGSDDPDAPVTLIDLETWATTAVAIEEAGEVGLFLTRDHLFHRNDVANRIEAYAIASLLTGSVEMLSTVPIGAGGHGESISMDGDTLYVATDEGIDVVAWDGAALNYVTTYAWESADRSGGRGYFQRLSLDGTTVVSYTADRSAPETEWTNWTNDALLVRNDDGVTDRIELGDGYVYPFGLSGSTALYYRMGGDGDEALVLDLATAEVTQRIPLEPMSGGPVPAEDIYAANQYRAVTMTTDGAQGFVTQGGDGIVVVLDLAEGVVAGTIETTTPLDGGGYLAVFGTADAFSDSIGR